MAAIKEYAGFGIGIVVVLGILTWKHPRLWLLELYKSPSDRSLIWQTILGGAEAPKPTLGPYSQFRQGPQRQGVFEVDSFPRELHVQWQTEKLNVGVHSASKASPVGDSGSIYVGDDSSWFHAFDLSGKERWKFYAGDASQGIHSTAALDASAVYFGTYRGALYKVDKASGRLIWSRILGETIGASPLFTDTGIIVALETMAPNGYLVKVDPQTGEILWKSPDLGQQSHSSPAWDETSQTIVLGANNSTIQGFDEKTGRRKWTLKVRGEVKSTPVLAQGIGVVGGLGREIVAFEAASGRQLWRHKLAAKSYVSPTYMKGKNQFVVSDLSGRLWAFDVQSGTRRWSLPTKKVGQRSSPVTLRLGSIEKIFFACQENELCLISDDGKIERTWPAPGKLTSVPFVQGRQIFLSFNEGPLVCYRW